MNEIDSWMTGANCNIEGKQTRKIMRYSGSGSPPAFASAAMRWRRTGTAG